MKRQQQVIRFIALTPRTGKRGYVYLVSPNEKRPRQAQEVLKNAIGRPFPKQSPVFDRDCIVVWHRKRDNLEREGLESLALIAPGLAAMSDAERQPVAQWLQERLGELDGIVSNRQWGHEEREIVAIPELAQWQEQAYRKFPQLVSPEQPKQIGRPASDPRRLRLETLLRWIFRVVAILGVLVGIVLLASRFLPRSSSREDLQAQIRRESDRQPNGPAPSFTPRPTQKQVVPHHPPPPAKERLPVPRPKPDSSVAKKQQPQEIAQNQPVPNPPVPPTREPSPGSPDQWSPLANALGIQDADRLPPESLKGEIVKKLSQLFPSIQAETTPPTHPSGAEPPNPTPEKQIQTLLQEFEKELGTRSPGTKELATPSPGTGDQHMRLDTLCSELRKLFPEGRFDRLGLVSDGELQAFWKDLTPEHVRSLVQGLRRSFPDHRGSWLASKGEKDFLGTQYERYYKALEVIEDLLQDENSLLRQAGGPGSSLLSDKPTVRAFFLDRDAEVLRVLKDRLPELVAALEGDSRGGESLKSARECIKVFTDAMHTQNLDRGIDHLEGSTDPKHKQFAEKLQEKFQALKNLVAEWSKAVPSRESQ